MKAAVVVPLVVIGSLLLIGGGVICAVSINNIQHDKLETTEYKLDKEFTNFNINLDTSNIEIRASDDGVNKVICEESSKAKHTVEVKDNALSIVQHDTRKWYEYIFAFNQFKNKVTVYLSSNEYNEVLLKTSTGNVNVSHDFTFNKVNITSSTGNIDYRANVVNDLSLEASTGNIFVTDVNANNLSIKASTGDLEFTNVNVTDTITSKTSTGNHKSTNVKASNYLVEASTGDVRLANVVMTNNLNVKTSTGNVKLEKCDASAIQIKTSTGSVKGTLLSPKQFQASSHTGSVHVPSSSGSETCKIETDTGSIEIYIEQ